MVVRDVDMWPSSCSTTPVYDRAAALARLRGNVTLLHDMAQFFHEDSPELVDSLRAAVDDGDFTASARAAHKLCGLSAAFDARDAVRAAEEVEAHAKAADSRGLALAARRLEAEVLRLDEALKADRA